MIVDCAPTGETLRLLSFPDVARWWLEKVFGRERAAARRRAAARPRVLRRRAARRAGPRRRPAAGREPDRDERDPPRPRARLAPAGDDAGPDGDRRGAADLHLPVPLRVPDRRGDRQPRLPRGGRGRLLRRLARAPARAARARRAGFAPVPVLRAPYFEQEVLGARCSTASARRCSTAPTPARCCTTARPGAHGRRRRRALRLELPFADKGDVSLKKIGLELVVAVDGQKRTLILPPALAPSGRVGGLRRRRADGELRWLRADALGPLRAHREAYAPRTGFREAEEAGASARGDVPPGGWGERAAGRARPRPTSRRCSACSSPRAVVPPELRASSPSAPGAPDRAARAARLVSSASTRAASGPAVEDIPIT